MEKVTTEKEEKKRRGCGCLGYLGIIILLIILIGSCAKGSDSDKSEKASTVIKQEESKKSEEVKEGEQKQEAATQPKTNQVTEQNGTCTIKGNKNSRGEKIYHIPGQQFYDKTNAEETFCSEADAKAAGYRASKK